MKIKKSELQELAASLHFELDEAHLIELYHRSEKLLSSLKLLNFKNIDHLTPMTSPNQKTCNVLREDIPLKQTNANAFLQNAKNKKDKYVVVK